MVRQQISAKRHSGWSQTLFFFFNDPATTEIYPFSLPAALPISRTNQLVHDWIPVKLPALLWVNTLVLLVSSVGMELARRQTKVRAAAVSTQPAGAAPAGAGGERAWLTVRAEEQTSELQTRPHVVWR